jgi:hypothetical protein
MDIYNILWNMWQKRTDDFVNLITGFYPKDKMQTKNIIGIRFENQNDKFDDIFCFLEEDTGVINLFKGTTEPSIYYTKNPMRQEGALRLALGFHENIWEWGIHRGKYNTLVQRKGCWVYRDKNANQITDEEDTREFGWFGCNFHPQGNKKNMLRIQLSSAGCQVPFEKQDWKYMRDSVKKSGMKEVSYLLLHEKQFSEL